MGLQHGSMKKGKQTHSRGTSYTTFNKDIKNSFSKQDKHRVTSVGGKLASITVDKTGDYGADRMKSNIYSAKSSSDIYRAARKHASKKTEVV